MGPVYISKFYVSVRIRGSKVKKKFLLGAQKFFFHGNVNDPPEGEASRENKAEKFSISQLNRVFFDGSVYTCKSLKTRATYIHTRSLFPPEKEREKKNKEFGVGG
jgi:hypothetical protein